MNEQQKLRKKKKMLEQQMNVSVNYNKFDSKKRKIWKQRQLVNKRINQQT